MRPPGGGFSQVKVTLNYVSSDSNRDLDLHREVFNGDVSKSFMDSRTKWIFTRFSMPGCVDLKYPSMDHLGHVFSALMSTLDPLIKSAN